MLAKSKTELASTSFVYSFIFYVTPLSKQLLHKTVAVCYNS